ncbi:MAG TPA: TadE family protein [Candidatus Dormibacteraeota bacterium]|nr:TadE family protein [Candidatus Dormibacteraeota bacterium]
MAKRSRTHHRRRGQALVEFSIALPVLILLVAGIIELGRGYAFAGAASDAARDAARYVAGKTTTTNGPGLANMCILAIADLAATTSNVTCPRQIGHPLPFQSPADFAKPAAGQALVLVYCGTSVNCAGTASQSYRTEIDVGVFYGFNDLNLLGGLVTISGTSKATTSW